VNIAAVEKANDWTEIATAMDKPADRAIDTFGFTFVTRTSSDLRTEITMNADTRKKTGSRILFGARDQRNSSERSEAVIPEIESTRYAKGLRLARIKDNVSIAETRTCL
jgi:hypothetical protein